MEGKDTAWYSDWGIRSVLLDRKRTIEAEAGVRYGGPEDMILDLNGRSLTGSIMILESGSDGR